MTRSLILPLLLVVQALVCDAHQDRVLTLKEGKLVGLPEEYFPAEYDTAKKKLRIGNHEMTFSPYLAGLFPDKTKFQLEITASWYHELDTLPAYINFKITPDGKDYSYRILINLETLELIELEVELRESEYSTRWLSIDTSLYQDELEKSRKLVDPELRTEKPKPKEIEDPFAPKQ